MTMEMNNEDINWKIENLKERKGEINQEINKLQQKLKKIEENKPPENEELNITYYEWELVKFFRVLSNNKEEMLLKMFGHHREEIYEELIMNDGLLDLDILNMILSKNIKKDVSKPLSVVNYENHKKIENNEFKGED